MLSVLFRFGSIVKIINNGLKIRNNRCIIIIIKQEKAYINNNVNQLFTIDDDYDDDNDRLND